MRRIVTALVAAGGGFLFFVQDALAMHNFGHRTSSGFPWNTVALWSAIGVGIVLLGTWLLAEGRRHHWLTSYRPVTHS